MNWKPAAGDQPAAPVSGAASEVPSPNTIWSQRTLALLAFAVVYWVSRYIFPGQADYRSLDLSWSQATAEAYKLGLQAGRDWLFTSGPLGWIVTGTYDPSLLVPRMLLGELVFKGLMALVLSLSVLRIPGAFDRTLYLLGVLLVPTEIDSQVLLAILAVGVWLAESRRANPWLLLGALVTLGLACMVKFTFFVGVHFALATVLLGLLVRRDSARARRLALAWGIVLASVWIASGQYLWNLPIYAWRSLEVALGYAEAMSSVPDYFIQVSALMALGLCAVLLTLAAWFSRRDPERLFPLVVGAGILYLAFQAGFVCGLDHPTIFFCFALAAPFLIVPSSGPNLFTRVTFPVLRAGAAWFVLSGLLLSMNARSTPFTELGVRFSTFTDLHWQQMTSPSGARDQADRTLRDARENWKLPHVRKVVGSSTIDMISFEQGLLFLNDLNWHPRPMIQGYSAYTAWLSEFNGRFLAGEDAPRFVLFRLQTIGDRLATQDDARALEVLLRDYTPRLIEREWVLYELGERKPVASERPVIFDVEAKIGETVELPALADSVHLLELDVHFSLFGKLRVKLTRPPPVWLEIRAVDGAFPRQRILPRIASTGVILDPLLMFNDDWIDWIMGKDMRHPKTLRVDVHPRFAAWFDPSVHFRLRRADDLVPAKVPELERKYKVSPLHDAPGAIESLIGATSGQFQNEEVLVVHTPASLAYRLLPGHYRLSLKYGVLPGASAAGSDGVVFRAGLGDGRGGKLWIFQRELLLAAGTPDVPLQSDVIEFDTPQASRLVLESNPGAKEDNIADWAFWRDVRIERLGDAR